MSSRSVRVSLLVVAVAAAVGLAACSGSSKNTSSTSTTTTVAIPKADRTVTADENGQTQTLQVGQTLNVELVSSGGTNYSWVVKPGYATAVITESGKPLSVPTNPGLPGGSVATVFQFKAVGAGSTDLVFELTDNSSKQVAKTQRNPITVTK